MIGTLTAELLILSVGNYMDANLIKEFCTFAKVALLVDYVLQLTFVIAILSIDIKRVEVKKKKKSVKAILFTNHHSSWPTWMTDKYPKDFMNLPNSILRKKNAWMMTFVLFKILRIKKTLNLVLNVKILKLIECSMLSWYDKKLVTIFSRVFTPIIALLNCTWSIVVLFKRTSQASTT